MRLTISISVLPVIIFFGGILFMHHSLSDGQIETFLAVWVLASLGCLVRGFFIFRSHRRLALCCFVVAFLQVVLAVVPALTGAYK